METILNGNLALLIFFVRFNASITLQVDCTFVKRKFYSSFNSVLNGCRYAAENVKLHLVKSYCLPLLTYCIGALELCKGSVRSIGVCWNDAFRKIYGLNRWESTALLQWFCKELPFNLIYDLHRWNFHCNVIAVEETPEPVCFLQRVLNAECDVSILYSVMYNSHGRSAFEQKTAIELFFQNLCIQRL